MKKRLFIIISSLLFAAMVLAASPVHAMGLFERIMDDPEEESEYEDDDDDAMVEGDDDDIYEYDIDAEYDDDWDEDYDEDEERSSQKEDGDELVSSGEYEQDSPDYDWDELSRAMTPEDTALGLGFADRRREYAVVVSVASSGADDDCGSKSDFYFQLIFEKGRSGVVLANTQLPADGFRTGETEVFYISTNRDYGDLESIRIIPDVGEGETRFDKLRIDTISVSETDASGVSEKWVFEDVGWIGSDYVDIAAGEADGDRTIEEISSLYGVSKKSSTINLLVCISTSDYGDEENMAVQYEGTIKGQIEYLSSGGMYRTRIFDVVEAMRDYNTADNGYETVASDRAYSAESLMESDPNRMLRANHMDRFVVTLEDAVSVSDLKLLCNSNVETTWAIESVSASLIRDRGSLILNPNDEYVRTSVTMPFATNTDSLHMPAYTVICAGAGVSEVTIPFTKNEIRYDEDSDTYDILTDPVISSGEDTLNIYVFPDETGDHLNVEEYDIMAALQYEDVYGTSHQISAGGNAMQRVSPDSEADSMFYATGLPASGISALSKIELSTADDAEGKKGAYIDHCIVQRVRGSMVIGTWYFDVHSDINGMIRSATPVSIYGRQIDISAQTLYVQFSSDTESATLRRGDKDISFRIDYRSSLSQTEEIIRSAYVSMADLGYGTLKPGGVYSISFNEPYVGEITGISVMTNGIISADITAAYAVNVSSAEEEVSTGYYSFAEETDVGDATVDIPVTAVGRAGSGVVLPLRISFVTQGAASGMESGTSGPVSVDIVYESTDGSEDIMELEDIRDYIIGEENTLSTGSTREILVLVPDIEELGYLRITPYGAGWSLSQISANLGEGMVIRSRTLDSRIGREGKKISLKDTYIYASCKVKKSSGDDETHSVSMDKGLALTMTSADRLVIRPSVVGSEAGWIAGAVLLSEDSDSVTNADDVIDMGGSITFDPGAGDITSGTYRITVVSRDDADAYITVDVTVSPSGEQSEVTESEKVDEGKVTQ